MSRASPNAAAVLHPYVTTQIGELTSHAPRAVSGDPDAIHDMRVASRRLKSILAVYRRAFTTADSEHLRTELNWLADNLGQARDPEVQRLVLRTLDVDSDTAHALDAAGAVMTRQAQATLVEALESERYQILAKGLTTFGAAPAWTSKAQRPTAKLVPTALRRQLARLDSRIDTAQTTLRPHADERLHAARKCLKRTRYATEAAVPLWGADAKDLARQLSLAQDALGDHNDLVATRSSAARWSELMAGGLNPSVWETLDRRLQSSRVGLDQRLIDLREVIRAGDVTLQAAPAS